MRSLRFCSHRNPSSVKRTHHNHIFSSPFNETNSFATHATDTHTLTYPLAETLDEPEQLVEPLTETPTFVLTAAEIEPPFANVNDPQVKS